MGGRRLPRRERQAPKLPHEARTLLDEIIAAPDDDAPRLVFADWLEARGDPRGELIAVQCELAQLLRQADPPRDRVNRLQGRAAELLGLHEKRWTAALRSSPSEETSGAKRAVASWAFDRGFVDVAKLNASDFVAIGERIFTHEPIRTLRLTGIGRDVRFLQVRGIHLLRELDISCNRMYRELAAKLASTRLTSLRRLRLDDCAVGPQALRRLQAATSERWPALRRLELARNTCKDSGAALLADWDALRQLEVLILAWNAIGREGITAIAAQPFQVRWLALAGNPIGPAGASALLRAPWPNLESLDLGGCGVGPSDPSVRGLRERGIEVRL